MASNIKMIEITTKIKVQLVISAMYNIIQQQLIYIFHINEQKKFLRRLTLLK